MQSETREMPHNFEAEQALLGAILVSNSAYHRVSEIVLPEQFADPLHGRIYDAASKLIERGQTASAFTLKAYLEQDPDAKKIGGGAYLARLMAASVHAHDAPTFGNLVRDLHLRRKIIALGSDAVTMAYGADVDRPALTQIEELERGLYDLASTGQSEAGFRNFSAGLTEAVKSAEVAHKRGGGLTGVGTGLRAMDKLLGGLHRSDLVIIAGRPSMGKTALATNIAFNAARAFRKDGDSVVDGATVGFFSLEMSSEQLATRIIAEHARIPSEKIRKGELNAAQFDAVLTSAQYLETLPLFIDDTPALTIGALRTRARRLKRTHGLELIVVDYLQLVTGSKRSASDGRVQEVSEITRGLKTLAKELNVPVLALSQLSRAVESRTDKRPQLSDLRDSGTIEQDADVVMFVYREEYYLERGEKNGTPEHINSMGKAEAIVAKQRHGPTGLIHLAFDGAFTQFSDVVGPA